MPVGGGPGQSFLVSIRYEFIGRKAEQDMQAIIMAAGKGSRLGTLTENKPKAFLKINGIRLIEYNIALLHAYGITDILIVTGYQEEYFEEMARKISGLRCIYNPFYEMANVLGSFYMAQEYLSEDAVYLHADTLCSPDILKEMLHSSGDMVLPVDFKPCDEEAMKVRTMDGCVTEISKEIPCDIGEGEFIGIARINKAILPDLRAAVKKLMKEKQFGSYFEGAVQELIGLQKYQLKALPTKDRFWAEIDFEEDYKKAGNEIEDELIRLAEREFGKERNLTAEEPDNPKEKNPE